MNNFEQKTKKRKYKVTLFWLYGEETSIITNAMSDTSRVQIATDAMNEMGYGSGAVRALDYWRVEEAME